MEARPLPKIGQIAIMVKDIEKAISYYSETLNVGPFATVEYKPERAIMRGKEVAFTLNLAFANWGDQNLELMEIAEGEPQHKEFLERTGGGVHHLGFYVDDVDDWINYFDKKGIPVLMDLEGIVGPRGRRRAVYFDTHKGGVLFEFIRINPCD